jgi:OFA family oxalate/formate antiporter-like MFS transporter
MKSFHATLVVAFAVSSASALAFSASPAVGLRPTIRTAASRSSLASPPLRSARVSVPPVAKAAAAAPAEGNPIVRGTLVVAGGVLAHFILGTMYCWGNLLAYAPDSLLFFDGLAHAGVTPDAVQVMPLGLVSLTLGMPVGARFNKWFGPRVTTFIGCALMALGTFLGSFQTRLLPFMLCYSVLAGFGTGMSYSTPMQASWTWFPSKKGLINGITLMGFGAGAFIFNKVGTGMALSGIAWGPMIRQLATMYAAVSLTGALLIKAKPAIAEAAPTEEDGTAIAAVTPPETCDPPGAEFKEAVTSKRFALLWVLGLMAFTPGLTILGLYKRFGMTSGGLIADDVFLSTIGGLGALANGAGRVFWGNLVDRLGYFRSYFATSTMTILLMLSLPFTVNAPSLFAAAVCGALFCLGGAIAMFVTVNAQVFGTRNAGEIYSLLFSAFALASVVGAKLTMALVASLGWSGIFKVLAGMGGTALGLLYLLKKEKAKPAPWE